MGEVTGWGVGRQRGAGFRGMRVGKGPVWVSSQLLTQFMGRNLLFDNVQTAVKVAFLVRQRPCPGCSLLLLLRGPWSAEHFLAELPTLEGVGVGICPLKIGCFQVIYLPFDALQLLSHLLPTLLQLL